MHTTEQRGNMYFLCIDKPEGYTSHDIVGMFRVLTGWDKIGHTGTLDPFASGALLLAIGSATKLIQYVPHATDGVMKRYQCRIQLGVETQTGDCTGEEVRRVEVPAWNLDQLHNVLAEFIGDVVQTPPIYSAIKVNGKKLYEYARQGISVEIPSRTIHIDSITCIAYTQDTIDLDVICSKGTYIRSLGVDIAAKLGTVGHLSVLRRLISDGVDISSGLSLPQVANMLIAQKDIEDWRLVLSKEGRTLYTRCSREEFIERLQPYLLSVEQVFANLPKLELTLEQAQKTAVGISLPIEAFPAETLVQLLYAHRLLAIAQQEPGKLQLQRVNPEIACTISAQQQ